MDRYATKEQCCAFINRIIVGDNRASIDDSVKVCKEKGIISSDAQSDREKNCTRQEFVTMLIRAIE